MPFLGGRTISVVRPPAFFYIGSRKPEEAAKIAGNGIVLMAILGLVYLAIGEILPARLLKLPGITTEVSLLGSQASCGQMPSVDAAVFCVVKALTGLRQGRGLGAITC